MGINQRLSWELSRTKMLTPDNTLSSGRTGRTRGIVHSILESGTARLIFDKDLCHFWGHLITRNDESFSITGSTSPASSPIIEDDKDEDPLMKVTQVTESQQQPSTSQTQMRVTVVDGETGDKFCVENVIVKMFIKIQEVTNIPQTWVEISNPCIKFRTSELLIAAIEIQKYLNPNQNVWQNKPVLTENQKRVHVGHMALNLVACEITRPSSRRLSMSFNETVGNPDGIVELADDFLV